MQPFSSEREWRESWLSLLDCLLNALTLQDRSAAGKDGSPFRPQPDKGLYAAFCRLLDREGVVWQCCELGKVDACGGGTVAMYLASLNMDVVDLGVPVLSMHSPFEVVSKLDVYMAYRAFKAFFEEK